MCKVSDRTQSDTGTSSKSESPDSGDANEKYSRIKSANRKVRLIDILRHYGIKIEKNHQRPTWSNNILCPLPNHKGSRERTPSFGYCFVSDHFHCLGCGQTGRAVEFISIYENSTRSSVADKILAKYGDDISQDDLNDYEDDLSPILLEGSKFFQECIQKHKSNPKKIKEIHKIIWWIDFYLMHKNTNKISSKELKHRIQRAKELLSDE